MLFVDPKSTVQPDCSSATASFVIRTDVLRDHRPEAMIVRVLPMVDAMRDSAAPKCPKWSALNKATGGRSPIMLKRIVRSRRACLLASLPLSASKLNGVKVAMAKSNELNRVAMSKTMVIDI